MGYRLADKRSMSGDLEGGDEEASFDNSGKEDFRGPRRRRVALSKMRYTRPRTSRRRKAPHASWRTTRESEDRRATTAAGVKLHGSPAAVRSLHEGDGEDRDRKGTGRVLDISKVDVDVA